MRFVFLLVAVFAVAGCGPIPSEACGPSTCSGCCDADGACQLGNSLSACGIRGDACEVCEGQQNICISGTCGVSYGYPASPSGR